jgi:hypothetical protein
MKVKRASSCKIEVYYASGDKRYEVDRPVIHAPSFFSIFGTLFQYLRSKEEKQRKMNSCYLYLFNSAAPALSKMSGCLIIGSFFALCKLHT